MAQHVFAEYTGRLRPVRASVTQIVLRSVRSLPLTRMLADSDENPAAEENLVHTMAKQVDGVIICAPFASDAQLRRLAGATSLVLVNRRCGAIPAVLFVALAVIVWAFWSGQSWALTGAAAVITFILLLAIRNEWDLVTWLAPRADEDAPDVKVDQ